MSFFGDDELTPEDLKFLEKWEGMGKSESADEAYTEENADSEVEFQVEGGAGGGEGEGDEPDPDADSDEQSDEVDSESDAGGAETESADTMSLEGSGESSGDSEGKSEGDDHLEKGESDSEIQEGEDDLELDDLELDGFDDDDEDFDEIPPGDQDDLEAAFDKANDDAAAQEQAEDNQDEDDSDDEIEDDGEGERANSDEARESDKPIEHHEDEPEDSETDSEKEDEELDKLDYDTPDSTPTPKADAEKVDENLDAQAELEDTLKDSEPHADTDDVTEQPQAVEPAENADAPEGQANAFDGLPAAGSACTNHCEDNATDDHDGECPHCTSRIQRERDLWGAIGTDMHGADVYPGDKLRVVLPMAFTVEGALLTANVPNQAIEPIRIAQATAGHTDTSICWLSGRISQFTGWHMIEGGNPIWTFPKGKRIGFAEKIGEPYSADSHGSNADEGDQLDVDDALRDVEKKATEESEKAGEQAYEDEDQPDEPKAEESDEGTDEPESRSESGRHGIPKHAEKRFEGLTERITKKIQETFGATLENMTIEVVENNGDHLVYGVKAVSRGMTYSFAIVMRRYDVERDGELPGDEDAA